MEAPLFGLQKYLTNFAKYTTHMDVKQDKGISYLLPEEGVRIIVDGEIIAGTRQGFSLRIRFFNREDGSEITAVLMKNHASQDYYLSNVKFKSNEPVLISEIHAICSGFLASTGKLQNVYKDVYGDGEKHF